MSHVLKILDTFKLMLLGQPPTAVTADKHHDVVATAVTSPDLLVNKLKDAVHRVAYSSQRNGTFERMSNLRFKLVELRTVIPSELDAVLRHWLEAPKGARDKLAKQELRKCDPDFRLDLDGFSGWRIERVEVAAPLPGAESTQELVFVDSAAPPVMLRFEFVGALHDDYAHTRSDYVRRGGAVPPQRKTLLAIAGAVSPWNLRLRSPSESPTMIGATQVVLGADSGCDVRLDLATISARHVSFSVNTDGRLQVTDLESTNGTYIRGQRLLPRSTTPLNSPTEVWLVAPTAALGGVRILLERVSDDDVSVARSEQISLAPSDTTPTTPRSPDTPPGSAFGVDSDLPKASPPGRFHVAEEVAVGAPDASIAEVGADSSASTRTVVGSTLSERNAMRLAFVHAGEPRYVDMPNLPQTINLDDYLVPSELTSPETTRGATLHLSKLDPTKVLVQVVAGSMRLSGQAMHGAHVMRLSRNVRECSQWIELSGTHTRVYLLTKSASLAEDDESSIGVARRVVAPWGTNDSCEK